MQLYYTQSWSGSFDNTVTKCLGCSLAHLYTSEGDEECANHFRAYAEGKFETYKNIDNGH